MTLAALSRRIGFDKSWTSRVVEQLVQEDLVNKMQRTEDRRTVQLSLSPAGEKRFAALGQTLDTLADRVFEYIPAEQHATVHASLELLHQALLTLTNEVATQEKGVTTCECD